jgi:uncharacterized repeat protein (TIGR01451 family)
MFLIKQIGRLGRNTSDNLPLPLDFSDTTMFINRHIVKHYRALSIASLIAGGSLLALLPALADQNSPTPNTSITNQATAQFTDAADSSTQNILSNTVTVTLAEVAGISATGVSAQGMPATAGGAATPVYRTNTVYFDFKIYNVGNDPTQIFIPGVPSSATITTGSGTPVAILAADIQQIQVIEYGTVAPVTNIVTTTAVDKDNLVSTTTGSATGNLGSTTGGTTAIPSGSIPAGGYVKVRIPVKVPFNALKDDVIKVTLGNTVGQPGNVTSTGLDNSNVPYVASGNDLYTQDNADPSTIVGEAVGVPVNGDGPPSDGHRQEASATQQAIVVNPAAYTISGTVWDDRNKSGVSGSIFNTGEFATNGVFGTNATPINVILVNDVTGLVIDNKTLTATGTYSFTNVQAITNVRIFLSDKVGVAGSAPPAPPTAPATTISSLGWVGTSPLTTSFTTGFANSPNKDFGIIQKAKLVLVKRITGMKKSTDLATDPMRRINPNDGKVLNSFINETTNSDDDTTMNWPTPPAPNNFLIGAVDGGKVSPGDTIEYTIYFLNNQGADATNIKLCDPILSSQTFKNNGYGTGKDMQLQIGADAVIDLTALNDTTVDRAYTYAAGSAPGTCNIPQANQAAPGVAIELTSTTASTNQPALPTIPGAIGHGTASTTSTGGVLTTTLPYGLFRFTTTVNP